MKSCKSVKSTVLMMFICAMLGGSYRLEAQELPAALPLELAAGTDIVVDLGRGGNLARAVIRQPKGANPVIKVAKDGALPANDARVVFSEAR
jgi:hypothetical protein